MDEIVAEITTVRACSTGVFTGKSLYGWKQKIRNLLTGAYEDPLAGRTGTVTSDTVWEAPALEMNNNPATVGTIVVLRPAGYVLGVLTYEFAYSAPGGVTVDSAVLATYYSITSTSMADTGLQIVLPSAGTYILTASVGVCAIASAFVGGGVAGYVLAELRNATISNLVPETQQVVGCAQVINMAAQSVGVIRSRPYIVSGASTIKLRAAYGAGTWLLANILGTSGGGTAGFNSVSTLTYEKVA